MKRKVSYACFQSAISAPEAGIGGDASLSINKQKDVEMWTGEEPGMLTVKRGKVQFGVPFMNIKSLVWIPELEVKNKLSA